MVRQLSTALCHGVVSLWRNALQQTAIARQYNITQGEVSKILKRNAETGVPTLRSCPGRPIKTTRRQGRFLLRMCTGGQFMSAWSLTVQWRNPIGVRVSRMLVYNRLNRAGYCNRIPLRKPLVDQRYFQRRLEWARDHQDLGPQHWRHVVFSDRSDLRCIAMMATSGFADELKNFPMKPAYYPGCSLKAMG